ncbi:MAG: BlaI/MecI/CopY family transcriptional regulator [Steroidobacteraceae bacterium]
MAISEAEAHVMQVLWQHSPRDADEVFTALPDCVDWQVATVKTLLNRLLKKGAVRAQKVGRRYFYAPVLKRDQWLLQESTTLLRRLFGGRVAPLVAHLNQQRRLSSGDLRDLRKLLGVGTQVP